MASQLMNDLSYNTELTGLAAAGTALLGGSLFYYLNNTSRSTKKNNVLSSIDLKTQSREVKVYKSIFIKLKIINISKY